MRSTHSRGSGEAGGAGGVAGFPDSQITLSVKIDDETQATTLKWKGKNLGANASVNCGYDCFVLGSTRFSFCSPADAAGKWKTST